MRDGLGYDAGGIDDALDDLRRASQNLDDCLRQNVTLPQVKIAFEAVEKHAKRVAGISGSAADRIVEYLNRHARVA